MKDLPSKVYEAIKFFATPSPEDGLDAALHRGTLRRWLNGEEEESEPPALGVSVSDGSSLADRLGP